MLPADFSLIGQHFPLALWVSVPSISSTTMMSKQKYICYPSTSSVEGFKLLSSFALLLQRTTPEAHHYNLATKEGIQLLPTSNAKTGCWMLQVPHASIVQTCACTGITST